MAYTATYTEDDVAPIVIDGIGTLFAVFVSLAGLVGLVLLWGFVKKNVK